MLQTVTAIKLSSVLTDISRGILALTDFSVSSSAAERKQIVTAALDSITINNTVLTIDQIIERYPTIKIYTSQLASQYLYKHAPNRKNTVYQRHLRAVYNSYHILLESEVPRRQALLYTALVKKLIQTIYQAS